MRNDLLDHEYMVTAHSDHAGSWLRPREAEPVGGEPQVAPMLSEDLYGRGTAAERAARTAFGMGDDPRFDVVVPNSIGLLLCCISALGFAIVAALVGLWLYHRAPAHVAINAMDWCGLGLSCDKQNERR